MKFKLWEEEDLEGMWEISIKIDGVRCHNTKEGKISRKGKNLYNIPDFDGEIAEIFCGNFKTTIENTRTFTKEKTISKEEIFTLYPIIDKRLLIGIYNNPTKKQIKDLFKQYHKLGHEGLILRQEDKRLKVKNKETFDVVITGIFEGRGRNKGRLGGFITDKGNVGTGLSDEDRVNYYTNDLIGTTIEVECMELTPDGKFRHPRFVRLREDK